MSAREFYWRTLANCRDLANSINKKLKPFYCPIQQNNNHGIYAVNINARIGFFAHLNWCLNIFAHCERLNLTPYIVLSSPYYTRDKGENWLEYYFDNLKLTETDRMHIQNRLVKVSNISDINQMGVPVHYVSQMSIAQAGHLLEKYVRAKSEIQDYVESFVENHFSQKEVLGIHYRGTDKKAEADPVSREYCAETIYNYLDANPQTNCLFVASDERAFIEWIQAEFKHIEVIFHDDKESSTDGTAIHVQPGVGDNYIKGKEALVNCLLLSKCNALIRTSSFLSGWSSVFNPHLPVVMLNRPYAKKLWFPDSAIIHNSMDRYLPGGTEP